MQRQLRREVAIKSKTRLNEREAYVKHKTQKQRLQKARDQFDLDFLKPWLENTKFQPFFYTNIGYNNKDNTSEKGELFFLYFFKLNKIYLFSNLRK